MFFYIFHILSLTFVDFCLIFCFQHMNVTHSCANVLLSNYSLTNSNVTAWRKAGSHQGWFSTRGHQFVRYGQNGDKPKRQQVQSKRINLLSSTMDLFSVLLTKFQ